MKVVHLFQVFVFRTSKIFMIPSQLGIAYLPLTVLHCSGELLFGLNVLALPHPLTVLHCNGELFGLNVGPLRQAW